MARSTYVYVVLEADLPVAAFTVKHELLTWTDMRDRTKLKFFRVRDGRWQDPGCVEIFYPFE